MNNFLKRALLQPDLELKLSHCESKGYETIQQKTFEWLNLKVIWELLWIEGTIRWTNKATSWAWCYLWTNSPTHQSPLCTMKFLPIHSTDYHRSKRNKVAESFEWEATQKMKLGLLLLLLDLRNNWTFSRKRCKVTEVYVLWHANVTEREAINRLIRSFTREKKNGD